MEADTTDWLAYHQQVQGRQLQKMIRFVSDNHAAPDRIQAHFSSLLTLLRGTRDRAELNSLAAELIAILHPLPSYWGEWHEWITELRFALGVYQADRVRHTEILDHLGGMYYLSGQMEQAIHALRQAEAQARTHHMPLYLARAIVGQAKVLDSQSQWDAVDCLLDDLETDPLLDGLHQRDPMATAEIAVRIHLARSDHIRRARSQLDQAQDVIDQAVTLVESWPQLDPALVAEVYRCRGIIRWARAEYDAARADLDRARQRYQQIGDVSAQGLTEGNLGLVYWSMGWLREAEQATRRSIEIAERTIAHWQLARQLTNLGLVYLFQGRLDEAFASVERGKVLASRLNMPAEVARAKGNQGVITLHLGNYVMAEHLLREDLAISEGYNVQEGIAAALVNLSRCCSAQGRYAEGLALAEHAYAIGVALPSPAIQMTALRAKADSMTVPEARRAILREAYALVQPLARALDEAGIALDLAVLSEDAEERATLRAHGLALLERMGAVGWLEKAHATPDQPPLIPALV